MAHARTQTKHLSTPVGPPQHQTATQWRKLLHADHEGLVDMTIPFPSGGTGCMLVRQYEASGKHGLRGGKITGKALLALRTGDALVEYGSETWDRGERIEVCV